MISAKHQSSTEAEHGAEPPELDVVLPDGQILQHRLDLGSAATARDELLPEHKPKVVKFKEEQFRQIMNEDEVAAM